MLFCRFYGKLNDKEAQKIYYFLFLLSMLLHSHKSSPDLKSGDQLQVMICRKIDPQLGLRKFRQQNPKLTRNVVVAAPLRSLHSDHLLSKGHPRSIEQELRTVKTFPTHIETIKLTILSI